MLAFVFSSSDSIAKRSACIATVYVPVEMLSDGVAALSPSDNSVSKEGAKV